MIGWKKTMQSQQRQKRITFKNTFSHELDTLIVMHSHIGSP